MSMSMNLFSVITFHLASVFFLSGLAKLISFKIFQQVVVDYRLTSTKLAIIIGSVIPWIEIIAALFLLYETTWLSGATVLLLLLLLFAYAAIMILRSEQTVSCGCYGRLMDAKVDAFTLGKIGYLIFLVGTGFFFLHKGSVHHTVPAVITGVSLTLLVLVIQSAWQQYQDNMDRLRKMR